MANYPTSDPSFSGKNPSDIIQASHVNALQDEVVAIGAALRGTLQHGIASTGTITERSRGFALGEWTTPTFSAANFTGSGSMTWTVAAGDVATFAYTIVGKKMTVAFVLNTTTVGGTPSTALQIAIPGSQTAAKAMYNPVLLIDNNARTTGYASVSGSTIAISRTDGGNFSASTDLTYVFGQISFEVS